MKICPICGEHYETHSALSRKDNSTPICPDCGLLESLEILVAVESTLYKMNSKLYTVYSQEGDITFIMEETKCSTSVVGFYYGMPDEQATKKYYGSLTAKYEE